MYPGQALAQEEKGDPRRKDRLGGGNQVDHAGGQVRQADVVQPEADQGRARRQQEQHAPTGPRISQPEEVCQAGCRAGDESAGEQVEGQQEDRREAEGVEQRRPRIESALGCGTSHQRVDGVPQAGEDTGEYPQQVGAPGPEVQHARDEHAAGQADRYRQSLGPVQPFLQQPASQQGGEGRRAVRQHGRDRRPVQRDGECPQRIEDRQHQAVEGEVAQVLAADPQQGRAQESQRGQQAEGHEEVAPEGQDEGGQVVGLGEIANEDGRGRKDDRAGHGDSVAAGEVGGVGHGSIVTEIGQL